MTAASTPRFVVRVVEHLWIPASGGIRLAARAWLPEGAPPAPAVLEYLPYRKRDGTRRRDETLHPELAAHGHPCYRVDVRGTGDSEGTLLDEYHEQEIADGLEILRWIAGRGGCDGRVVLLGKSWGGINALAIAARRPPELAAVVSVCATDDLAGNDAHYMGGRLLAENLIWGVGLMAVAAHPPDPRLVGAGWRETWRARLEAVRPFPRVWMEHAPADAYWRRAIDPEAAAAIGCPMLLVGGTEDPYRNALARLADGPGRSVVLGPWAHLYPHLGHPGPALDFPRHVAAWLGRRLGPRGDAPAEPDLLVYLTAGARAGDAAARDGRWAAFEHRPLSGAEPRTYGLGDGVLGVSAPGTIVLDGPVETGLAAGGWCRFGVPGEGPYEQTEDDRRSVCFDSPPLTEPVDLLGIPSFHGEGAPGGSSGLLCVRLCEVHPDGRSDRVAYGFANVNRDAARVDVPLELTAHRVRRGSRLRLALSNACFPVAWPLPTDGPVALRRETARLVLPVLPGGREAALPAGFPSSPPAGLPPEPDFEGFQRTVSRDPHTGTVRVRATSDLDASGTLAMARVDEIALSSGHGVEEVFEIRPGDRASARGLARHVARLEVPGLRLDVEAAGRIRSVGGALVFEGSLEARENGRHFFSRAW